MGRGGFTPGGVDGIDTLRNMERLRFFDVEIDVPKPPTDIQWTRRYTEQHELCPVTGPSRT